MKSYVVIDLDKNLIIDCLSLDDGVTVVLDEPLILHEVDDIILESVKGKQATFEIVNGIVSIVELYEKPPEPIQISEIEQLKLENNNLKLRLLQAEQITSETSSTQQQLIEQLIELGVM